MSRPRTFNTQSAWPLQGKLKDYVRARVDLYRMHFLTDTLDRMR